jgi:diguanylate cyclase (GGDEF)-like protein
VIGSPILSGEALAQQALLPPLEAMQGEAMQGEAMLDPLLRILNRTALEALIERQHAAALAGDASFLLLKIDIDYFTRINESYGPAVGDSVLTEVLRALRANLRSGDEIGRYAADEFLLVLPNIALSSGERLARRLNDSVAALRVATSAKSRGCRVSIGCSVSIGIAEWTGAPPAESAQSLVGLADAALLAAKRHGNCARVGRRPEPVRPS